MKKDLSNMPEFLRNTTLSFWMKWDTFSAAASVVKVEKMSPLGTPLF